MTLTQSAFAPCDSVEFFQDISGLATTYVLYIPSLLYVDMSVPDRLCNVVIHSTSRHICMRASILLGQDFENL